jgi:formylglycine-generating enzyme required for sulfatase activity
MAVTIDAGWHPLADGAVPDWASTWGQDRFGIYVAFQIGAASQRMRWIPPGRFWMGSPEDEAGRWEDEGPRHEVTLESGFWLFDTPCTQALWQAVMGENPSRFISPTRPVEQVSFDDVQRFLERVNERVPGLDLELPSEAQWEYACRAGTDTATYAGDMRIIGERNAPVLDAIAWYGGNSGVDFDLADGLDSSDWKEKQYNHTKAGTRKVGLKTPNPWGLHDMLGNVWEWCADAWHDSYAGAPTDGSARVAGGAADRVLRGGSWNVNARYVRAASRDHYDPAYRGDSVGFRCARVQSASAVSTRSVGQGGASAVSGANPRRRPARSGAQ